MRRNPTLVNQVKNADGRDWFVKRAELLMEYLTKLPQGDAEELGRYLASNPTYMMYLREAGFPNYLYGRPAAAAA